VTNSTVSNSLESELSGVFAMFDDAFLSFNVDLEWLVLVSGG
jgi:hypothetical protein